MPEGARSVSWPWYHHEIGDELTTEAKKVLEMYSKILPDEIESHIYRIVRPPNPPRPPYPKSKTKHPTARQSLGHLPLALHRRILVPLLRPLQAPSLHLRRPPASKSRRNTPRPGRLPRARSPQMCLRRRACDEPLRQRSFSRIRGSVLRAVAGPRSLPAGALYCRRRTS